MKGGVPTPPKRVMSALLEWEKEFTQKEVSEYIPKMTETLQTVWQYMDLAVRYTNRKATEAHIWQTIDPSETKVIATHLCEMAAKSKVVATAVRKITNAHRLLQIGVITVPRFMMTVNHYKENGGFFIPFLMGRYQVTVESRETK